MQRIMKSIDASLWNHSSAHAKGSRQGVDGLICRFKFNRKDVQQVLIEFNMPSSIKILITMETRSIVNNRLSNQ